jgi:hypothetical protein
MVPRPHRNLDADTDPWGPEVLQDVNPVESFRWLLTEVGARGLSGLFSRGEGLVFCSRVDEDGYIAPEKDEDDNGPATINTATVEVVIARLALNYLVWHWKRTKTAKWREEKFFPTESARFAVRVLDQMPNLRPLRGITHTPMVRPDGTILAEPGYDDASGFLHLPTIDVPPVTDRPTRDEVGAAVALLRGMVDEFKWVGPHDEAAYLGLLLTPLLRQMCPPPYKAFGLMAHQRGSGKSLLAWIAREVHGGVFRSEMPHDDPELDKQLVSLLLHTTGSVVTFDNVSGTLRSSRFEGLLTSAVYSGRVLGSTNFSEMPNDRVWTVTGNNLSLAGDLDRRTMLITIDPMEPKPELRTGFRLDLNTWVPEHRADVLHALLTITRAWVVADRPMERRSSDSYALWSATVRGILTHAGVPGEFDHASCAPQQSSTDPEGWGALLLAAREVFESRPWTVRELLTKVHDGRGQGGWDFKAAYDGEHPIPLDALPSELADKFVRGGAPAVSRALGMWLRNRNRRFVGELANVEVGETRDHVKVWSVQNSAEMRAGRGAAA